jgi:hypothetical protein
MHGQGQAGFPSGTQVEPLKRGGHGGVPDPRDPTAQKLSPVSFGLGKPCVLRALEQRIARPRLGKGSRPPPRSCR